MNLQDIATASAMLKTELAPVFEKIGQGAEWGYGVFVKQAYVEAAQGLLMVPVGVICLLAMRECIKNAKVQENTPYGDSTGWWLAAISLFIAAMLFIVLPLASAIQVAINPDYAAIQLIIRTVKGGTQ